MRKNDIQNIYDNPEFFEKYKQLRLRDQSFNNLLEQPALYSLLPSLKGKSVLDIGCGFGDFCRYVIEQEAGSVLGIDPSQNMIEEAKKLTSHNHIQYQCIAAELAEFSPKQFDMIISSLAFHYVADYPALIQKIATWLKPKGCLIFSVEHPICTAYPEGQLMQDKQGRDFHPVYGYGNEGLFNQTWFVENVQKYHRTLARYINTLIENGFTVEKVLEPMPSTQVVQERKELAIYWIRPTALMIKAHL